MGIFEALTEATRPANQNRPIYKESWELKDSDLIGASSDYPGHVDWFLDADCTIIVDMNKIDENDFGSKDITIEQYLSEYCEGDVEDLDYSWLTIDDMIKNTFDVLKDTKVCHRMKIFIHSEKY